MEKKSMNNWSKKNKPENYLQKVKSNIQPLKVVSNGATKPHREPCNLDFYSKLEAKIGYSITEDQKDIIEYVDGSSLVKATAGAGKTTTMTAKIGRMVLVNNIPASKILAMSFSKYSAKDLEKRYYELFSQPEAKGVQFSTIHSFAYQVVKEQYRKQNKPLVIIEGKESPINKKQYLSRLHFYKNEKYTTVEELDNLLTDISFVKNRMINPSSIRSETKNFNEIFNDYEKMKKAKDYLDFDDMLTECLQYLESCKKVQEHYSSLYSHVFLDEAQDVSPVQAEIIKQLTFSKNNLTLVADDDQTIYQWRGSAPEFVINYAGNFPKTVLFDLGVNYRCAPNILSPAKNLIEHNIGRLPKKIEAHKPNKGIFELIEYKSPYDQYSKVLKILKGMSEEQLKESAILFRNNESAVPFIDAFYENNIPFYVKVDRIGFFTSWLVKDIMNAFKIIINPCDADAFRLIARRLDLWIPDNVLKNIKSENNVFDTVRKTSNISPDTQRKAILINRKIKTFKFVSIENSIEFVMKDMGYKRYLDYRVEIGEVGEQFYKQIIQIMNQLGRKSESIDAYRNKMISLFKYIQGLRRQKLKSGVSLLTMHASKGLEFENIFVVDMIKGVFPQRAADENLILMEEERRLCYVAVTRAKSALYVLYDKHQTSSFIGELISPIKKVSLKKTSSMNTIIWEKEKIPRYSNMLDCHIIKDKRELTVGLKVVHNSFGEGRIVETIKNIVRIQFNNTDTRDFYFDLVSSKGLLQIKNIQS